MENTYEILLQRLTPYVTRECLIGFFVVFLYFLYIKAFKYYAPKDKISWDKSRGQFKRGTQIPCYPNGWFRVCHKNEIEQGYSKYFKLNGRHIAVFRGEDNQVYAVHAFCSHMGANLGIGGKVKWNSCVECPFHGWAFDGKTGKAVASEFMDEKICSTHEYHDIQEMKKRPLDNKYIKECVEKKSALKKYHIKELNNIVYVWFHAKDIEPEYELFDVMEGMEERGDCLDFVNCQIQEIPENGADFKHFEFIHESWVDLFYPYIKFRWVPKDRKPTEEDFDQVMKKHWNKDVEKFQQKLFGKYINDKNKQYINNLVIDTYVVLFERFEFYVETATVFQVGPGVVFLFIKFFFCSVVVAQSVTPLDKFSQQVHHKVFAPWWVPYWFSTLVMSQFREQFINDKKIWNNKIFPKHFNYNPKSELDLRLRLWREWYGQYYEGVHEFEKQNESMDW